MLTTTTAATGNSNNRSDVATMAAYSPWQAALIVVTCGIIIIGTIIGNALVCTAVAIVRKLRTPSNLLIVSLAVSDLLVAVLVMPFATTYEVMGSWVAGQAICDMWTSLDVMLCTASILNLCMISVDRYFVITRPFQYAMKRTPARMTIMIVCVWMASALISIPPLFGWKADHKPDQCVLSQNVSYQFYATIGAFYLPLAVMIVIYYRIYMVSSRIAAAEAKSKPVGSSRPVASSQTSPGSGEKSSRHCVTYFPAAGKQSLVITDASTLGKTNAGVASGAEDDDADGDKERGVVIIRNNGAVSPTHPILGCRSSDDMSDLQLSPPTAYKNSTDTTTGLLPLTADSTTASRVKKLLRAAAQGGGAKLRRPRAQSPTAAALSNECKATKTLGIIMGAFTACWLPFFIVALVKPTFCADESSSESPSMSSAQSYPSAAEAKYSSDGSSSCVPDWLSSLFQWLGYANSFLNPIIYARFNRDFRTPFKEILLLRCRDINVRLRTVSYAEQYGGDGGFNCRAIERSRGGGGGSGCRGASPSIAQYECQGRTTIMIPLEKRKNNCDTSTTVPDVNVTSRISAVLAL